MGRDLFMENEGAVSLSSKIFNILREEILDGKYKPGEKLIEGKLAEELGVSRTPVREGLKQLELEGLVENIPNKGTIVKGISLQDINDILTIRLVIEGIAVEWAVERMDEHDLNELKEIYELMEFYTMKQDVDKILDLNTRFHEVIYRATKSRFLNNMLKDFQYYIKGIREKSLKTSGRLESALGEHKEILEAFIKKDKEKARQVIQKHISTLKQQCNKVHK